MEESRFMNFFEKLSVETSYFLCEYQKFHDEVFDDEDQLKNKSEINLNEKKNDMTYLYYQNIYWLYKDEETIRKLKLITKFICDGINWNLDDEKLVTSGSKKYLLEMINLNLKVKNGNKNNESKYIKRIISEMIDNCEISLIGENSLNVVDDYKKVNMKIKKMYNDYKYTNIEKLCDISLFLKEENVDSRDLNYEFKSLKCLRIFYRNMIYIHNIMCKNNVNKKYINTIEILCQYLVMDIICKYHNNNRNIYVNNYIMSVDNEFNMMEFDKLVSMKNEMIPCRHNNFPECNYGGLSDIIIKEDEDNLKKLYLKCSILSGTDLINFNNIINNRINNSAPAMIKINHFYYKIFASELNELANRVKHVNDIYLEKFRVIDVDHTSKNSSISELMEIFQRNELKYVYYDLQSRGIFKVKKNKIKKITFDNHTIVYVIDQGYIVDKIFVDGNDNKLLENY